VKTCLSFSPNKNPREGARRSGIHVSVSFFAHNWIPLSTLLFFRRLKYFKLERDPYRYRRKLPHVQLIPTLFISFSTYKWWILPPEARSIVFASCMYEHQRRVRMHACVVMPDHVHLLLTVLKDNIGVEPPIYGIVKDIKSASVHKVNKALNRRGRMWLNEAFDRMPRSGQFEKFREYIIMNPVRAGLSAES
jgi:REP element-mobilizing transposase RayT